jgi:integrative and conjugative element protein (TIGR02256 family)
MESTKRLWRCFARRLKGARGAGACRLYLSAEARELITREAALYRDVETGGILIGRIESATVIHVTHASGPGPNAVHQPAYFLRDTAYCAGVLREHYERQGADYVGEWHTHIEALRVPSPGDLLTLAGIIGDPDYDFEAFAMLLAVKVGKRRSGLEFHGFFATAPDSRTMAVEEASVLKA